MTYDPPPSRTPAGALPFVLGVLVVGLLVYGGARYLGARNSQEEEPPAANPPVASPSETPAPDPPEMSDAPSETPSETADEILETLGIGIAAAEPGILVEQIGRNLEAGNIRAAANMIGRQALTDEQVRRLHELAAESRLQLNADRPFAEIGELEINKKARWALNLDHEEGGRIYFDLKRGPRGWEVHRVTLPAKPVEGEPPKAVLVDALAITDAFLHAALEQNFDTAKSFVDPDEVSDAKIAGLCIVFEEGDYRLRPRRPLRALFNRDQTAAFIAHVETPNGTKAAEFGLGVQRADASSPWRVTEINLDALLADYANRVAGGDVYFTPLIHNPQGGDTLILYFGFDEDELTARTKRQLQIVSLLLQTDSEKQLTLSGHTDGIGSDAYNKGLSQRRAETVRSFLVSTGVEPDQIKVVALGKSRPRRPNTTDSGEDDPLGRRANRRTEIYLDF